MKRIYEKVAVQTLVWYLRPYTNITIIDKLIGGGEITVYEGKVSDASRINAKYHGICEYKAMHAAVRDIAPVDNGVIIRIDTRHEEF